MCHKCFGKCDMFVFWMFWKHKMSFEYTWSRERNDAEFELCWRNCRPFPRVLQSVETNAKRIGEWIAHVHIWVSSATRDITQSSHLSQHLRLLKNSTLCRLQDFAVVCIRLFSAPVVDQCGPQNMYSSPFFSSTRLRTYALLTLSRQNRWRRRRRNQRVHWTIWRVLLQFAY